MNTLIRSEIAVLIVGWLISLFFLFYSEGIFDSSHKWSSADVGFILFALVFAVPYALTGLFCWCFKQFAVPFLLISVVMVVMSTSSYYFAYFPAPTSGAGWVFLMVPGLQVVSICVFTGVIFIVKKLSKSTQ